MRRVDRKGVAPPKALTGDASAAAGEMRKAAAYVAKARSDYEAARQAAEQAGKPRPRRPRSYGFKVYKDDGTRRALETLFGGKCAYCETFYASQAPVDVEHFRPKGEVEGDEEHWGYWWLAASWDNLLPSCIDCNRRRYQILPVPQTASLDDLRQSAHENRRVGKANAFPVEPGTRAYGTSDDPQAEIVRERPYLLDPCHDDPDEHLEFLVDWDQPLGLVLPRARTPDQPDALPLRNLAPVDDPAAVPPHVSARGAVSIQVYGLNRLGLVQARTALLRQLELRRLMILDVLALGQRLADARSKAARDAAPAVLQLGERMLAEIIDMSQPGAPYSAMVRQWLRRWLDELKPPST
ncbi:MULTISPECIES: endonuclease [unclassified Paracoccus (in: a-proteobacteria)]|uniref:endonuclease n=1 Tax=unclassified Paracoccus (in: a-proteobacteria) TaxID=2688777 RepID=UPI0012B1F49E|nr:MULTISPECIES: endonuclease [unclassified Paracoccus (in: a-proteobacteria)]UXU76440.1 hypothetical protein GB879_013740 [Paracoccus sp. SMMA_5]UXU82222.1 hypothetical protein GB880_014695 [Paracoccus sp. SMMA_5_TC]